MQGVYKVSLFLVFLLLFTQGLFAVIPRVDKGENDLDTLKKKSTLCFPINISLAYLTQLLEKEVPHTLYTEKNIDAGYGVKLDLGISRNGKIRLQASQLAIETKAPIKIAALLHFSAKEKLKLNLQKSQNLNAELEVTLRTAFQIGKNWQLLPKTEAQYKWLREPSLSIFGFQVNLGKAVDPIVKSQLADVAKLLDKQIKENVSLAKELNNVLQKLATPIPVLEKDNFIWLIAKPIDIGIKQVEDKSNFYLRFQTSIEMDLLTVISKTPPPAAPPAKITHNNAGANFCEQSTFSIPVIVDYGTVAQVAKELVASQKFRVNKKYTAQVKDIYLAAQNGRLNATIAFDLIRKNKKIFPSRIFLDFKPIFNEYKQQFLVEGLQYKLETQMGLLRLGNKFFPKKIRNTLDSEIELAANNALKDFKTSLQKGLKFSDNDLRLAIDTHILKSDILSFHPTDSTLSLVIDALAKIQLKIE
jgi:hypothetical protein